MLKYLKVTFICIFILVVAVSCSQSSTRAVEPGITAVSLTATSDNIHAPTNTPTQQALSPVVTLITPTPYCGFQIPKEEQNPLCATPFPHPTSHLAATPFPTTTPYVIVSPTPQPTAAPIQIKEAPFKLLSDSVVAEVPLGSRFIEGVATIDLDNDSQDELVVLANVVGETPSAILTVYRWENGRFEPIYESDHLENYAFGLEVCDIDANGQEDILAVFQDSLLPFYINQGVVTTTEAVLPHGTTLEVDCQDLDQDGRLEFLLGSPNPNGGSLDIYSQEKSSQPILSLPGTNEAHHKVILNLNGDEQLDIVRYHHGKIYARLNEGQFQFSDGINYSFNAGVASLTTADFDVDGLDDLIVAESWGAMHFFRNDSEEGLDIRYTGSTTDSVLTTLVHDLNHDGLPDVLAIPFKPSGELYYYENQGDFGFLEMLIDVGFPTKSVNLTMGDFDRNGMADLAFGTEPIRVIFDVSTSFVATE
ncbi:MAG: FG-GAP-like repeat-containing protein [Chloroflexota bacterium]